MASNNGNHLLSRNPIIGKLTKITESDSTNSCTYAGIARKLIFFMVIVAVGVFANLFLEMSGIQLGEVVAEISLVEDGEPATITMGEIFIILGCTLLLIISPILATIFKPTIPVTGSLYCLSTGFLLSWLATTLGDIYRAPILLALVITLMIVATMGFLYGSGIIKVTQKMKTFIMTAGIVILGASLLIFIGSLIPGVNTFVAQLAANPVLSIGSSVLMVVLGTLFLLVDFDTIRECVDNALPKKYEWYASFGLAFSVIWLYFKVLELILKIMGKSKN